MSLYIRFKKGFGPLCMLLACCTACHKDDTTPQKKAQEQKILRFYLQNEPMSLDPTKGGNRISQVILAEVFEGLMRIDANGRPSFAQAERVDLSDDKLTYTFHLRPSLWSNGMPVTAYDFEYTWKGMLRPDAPTAFSNEFYCIKNGRKAHLGEVNVDDVGIHALDEKTLLVTLEHPSPYFIELTANPLYSPLCKAVVEKNSNWYHEANPDYVSNGPFTLAAWKHRSEIVLAKNEYYWDAASVKTETMTFPILEDPQTALNLYEAGELDWLGDPMGSIPFDSIAKYKAENKLQVRNMGSAHWLQVNTEHPLLRSPKIRQALAMSINRHDISEHLLQGGETPAYTILPETLTLLVRPTFKDNDVQAAKTLFDEGLSELGVSLDQAPPVTLHHYAEPVHRVLAEAIQQQWQKALGLQVTLSASDRNAHLSRIVKGDFDIAGITWYTFFHDPVYNLELFKYGTAGQNYNGTHWEHPHYRELLDQSDHEPNLAARDDILREAEEFLMQEMPVIPVCYNTSKFVKNDILFGESVSPIGMLELKGASFAHVDDLVSATR